MESSSVSFKRWGPASFLDIVARLGVQKPYVALASSRKLTRNTAHGPAYIPKPDELNVHLLILASTTAGHEAW